ncbi:MAG: mobile mystery protein A [Gammaproteobacteria bacterium]|nr:MAG: mobile mystery protein A [Gammaproteobacteria bacterium]RLA29991.1 MAG: mobile mystery protein A [Gammaproteobacteria bacterium]
MGRKSTRARRLEVSRIDEYLQTLKTKAGLRRQAPSHGWIRTMRDVLGMSVAQLAKRLDVSRAAVYKLEEREVSRGISLKQLDRAAGEMDCDVFYAFVPRNTVEQSIRDQSRERAETKLTQANVSMGLEAEGVKGKKFVTAVSSSSSYAEALTDRHLWDE